jgi:hypothetical protein
MPLEDVELCVRNLLLILKIPVNAIQGKSLPFVRFMMAVASSAG